MNKNNHGLGGRETKANVPLSCVCACVCLANPELCLSEEGGVKRERCEEEKFPSTSNFLGVGWGPKVHIMRTWPLPAPTREKES